MANIPTKSTPTTEEDRKGDVNEEKVYLKKKLVVRRLPLDPSF